MPFCTKCGGANDANAAFCRACGAALPGAATGLAPGVAAAAAPAPAVKKSSTGLKVVLILLAVFIGLPVVGGIIFAIVYASRPAPARFSTDLGPEEVVGKPGSLQYAVAGMKHIRGMEGNTGEFLLLQVLRMDNGALCYTYKRNGSLLVTQSVLLPNGQIRQTVDDDFNRLWQKECGGSKTGHVITKEVASESRTPLDESAR